MWSLLVIPPLLPMMVSDWKERTVGVLWLAAYGTAALTASALENGVRGALVERMLPGLLVCLVLWVALEAYSILRKKKLTEMLGAGDMVFVLLSTSLFLPLVFVRFLLISFTVILMAWLILGLVGKRQREIPLVTGIGFCLIILVVYKVLVL